MPNPEPLVCGVEGCQYSTPSNCPTWDNMIKLMELHVRQAHPAPGPGQPGPAGGGSKQERLPRPTLEAGISDADWSFFVSQWERYKRSTKIMGQDAIDQLWACASEELSRQCHDPIFGTGMFVVFVSLPHFSFIIYHIESKHVNNSTLTSA